MKLKAHHAMSYPTSRAKHGSLAHGGYTSLSSALGYASRAFRVGIRRRIRITVCPAYYERMNLKTSAVVSVPRGGRAGYEHSGEKLLKQWSKVGFGFLDYVGFGTVWWTLVGQVLR